MDPNIVNHGNHDSKKEESLQELKALIEANPEINEFSEFLSDSFLRFFLKKYEATQAFAKLENHFRIKKGKHNKLYKNLLPSTTMSRDKGIVRVMKQRDHLQRMCTVINVGKWDPNEIPLEDVFKYGILVIDETMKCKDLEENGTVLIYNAAGYGYAHLKTIGPKQILDMVSIFWSNYPVQYKGIHVINEPLPLNLLIKAVKPFLPQKLRERLHIHGSNNESLLAHLSPKILPTYLGGELHEDDAYDIELEERILQNEARYVALAEKL